MAPVQSAIIRQVRPALVIFALLTLLTGFFYPLVITALAQLAFPAQANGGLLYHDGRVAGSGLIGQHFTSPGSFWGRPSATSPAPYNAALSGGSNLGPANPVLLDDVKYRVEMLHAADPGNSRPIPVDLVTASGSGLGPAIFTAVIGVLAFDFFFVPPHLTFHVEDTEYLITFAGMIVVGAVVSFLVARARENAAAAETRERETGTLFGLSQNLAVAGDLEAVAGAITRHIRETLGWESVLLLPGDGGLLPRGRPRGSPSKRRSWPWSPGPGPTGRSPGMIPIPSRPPGCGTSALRVRRASWGSSGCCRPMWAGLSRPSRHGCSRPLPGRPPSPSNG